MSRATPEKVLKSIVDGINTGNLDALMTLYEPEAAFATQPGSLAHGLPGVRGALAGFISMKGKLDLKVTKVLQVTDLALVLTVWSFTGTGPDGSVQWMPLRSRGAFVAEARALQSGSEPRRRRAWAALSGDPADIAATDRAVAAAGSAKHGTHLRFLFQRRCDKDLRPPLRAHAEDVLVVPAR